MNVGRLDQIRTSQDARPTDQAKFNTRQGEIIKSLGMAGQQIIPDLTAGNMQSVVAKLQRRRADLIQQNIPTDETDEALQLAQSENPADHAFLLTQSQQAVDMAATLKTGTTGLASAKTDILNTGATIQALPTGETVVRDPSGNQVTGQARLDVLAQARTQEQAKNQLAADTTVDTTRRVEQVKNATATADKAFGMVDKIRQNITNLKEVVPLIGQGANTGPISNLFPSIKASTIKIEQLQKRLGLDVVGAVTFGALSKGELDLAQAVALPLNLEGDALIQWANDSIAAKEKLAGYFEEQSIFLSQGNTQSDWLKLKRDELKATLGGATESDIRATMKENNMTRQQVLEELKKRGASGG